MRVDDDDLRMIRWSRETLFRVCLPKQTAQTHNAHWGGEVSMASRKSRISAIEQASFSIFLLICKFLLLERDDLS
jgi:hypothetical protein